MFPNVNNINSSFANGTVVSLIETNANNIRDKCWSVFRPYFVLGRYFGLSYTGVKGKRKRIPVIANCILTFLLICFCVGRGISFLKFEKFSAILVFKFLLLLYAIHCFVSYCMLTLIQRTGVKKFVALWELANQDETELPSFAKLHRLTQFGVVYVILCSVMNGMFVGFGSNGLLITFPFIESYFIAEYLMPVNGLIVFYTSIGFCAAQMIYCTVCCILLAEYWHLKKALFSCDLDLLKVKLSYYRKKHFILMKLTDLADDMLSYYAFAIYAFNLPTFIMTAFMLTREQSMNAASKVTFALWVGVLLFQICIVSLVPSAVNYLAHVPIKLLEEVSNRLSLEPGQMSAKVFRQLSLFIGQLTSTNIGITGGGFFVITKNMLLTLISIVISYFALIIQFDLSAKTECVCHCNQTSS